MNNKIVTFLSEVKSELEKITWPKRDEFLGSTIVVLILTAFFAVVLGGMDTCFGALIKQFLRF